jgi:hypothetical protein
MPDFLTQIISDHARQPRAWRKTEITPATILLAAGVATCYRRSVNRNIFYIIGVIVVIIIVLKVLHLF